MVDCYLGEIRIFSGNYAPSGWSICDGKFLNVNTYQALFSLISYDYGGSADKFALPDFRGQDGLIGRVPIGAGPGAGLTDRKLAETGGSSTVGLKEAEIPAHRHDFMVSTKLATGTLPAGSVLADPTDPVNIYIKSRTVAAAGIQPLNRGAVGVSGLGEEHTNIMPSLGVNYIIALTGIFPSSS